jgi:hypothetical protein
MANKAARPSTMIRSGILPGSIAIFLGWLDRLMFYVLASGSILLTIAFSSHSLDSITSRVTRASESATARRGFRNAL